MSDKNKNKKDDAATTNNATAPAPSPNPNAEAEKILAEAREQAAKIVAEAEAKAKAAEAESKEGSAEAAAAEIDLMEELVDYTAPLLPNLKKRDILVGVNGEVLRIKRGVPVKIKRKHYEALQNAAEQEFSAMEARLEIKKLGETPLANM